LGRGECGDGAVVDDATAARSLALHDPYRLLRAEKRAGQVRVDSRLPLLVREVLQRDRGRAAAGVVEQDIQATEDAPGLVEQRAHRGRVGHVGADRERAVGRRTGCRDHLLQELTSPGGEHDAIAILEQRERGCLADAGAGAGDQRDLSVQPPALAAHACLSAGWR
jgi:hypothetical protein